MHLNLTAILFLVLGWFSSPKKVHDKLQKLYEKDKAKCEQLAKNYCGTNDKQAEAYYFLSKIYFDKSENNAKLSTKYLYLVKSLSFDQKLKKCDTSRLYDIADWHAFRKIMISSADSLIGQLKKGGYDEKAETLKQKLDKMERRPRIIEHTESKPLVIEASFKIAKNENGQFFGMPLGTELVPSHNEASEKELISILNKARKEKGLHPLVWDEDLARAARYHACDLATQNYFDHATYDLINGELVQVGGTFDRIKKFYTKGFVNSENIAAGNRSANETYLQWYYSPGHYNNMFNQSSKKVGVGIFYDPNSSYSYYWVFCTALN